MVNTNKSSNKICIFDKIINYIQLKTFFGESIV